MYITSSSNKEFKSFNIGDEIGIKIIEDKNFYEWAYNYAYDVLKCRWSDIGHPEIEDLFAKIDNGDWENLLYASNYARDFLHCDWIEIDPIKYERLDYYLGDYGFNYDKEKEPRQLKKEYNGCLSGKTRLINHVHY